MAGRKRKGKAVTTLQRLFSALGRGIPPWLSVRLCSQRHNPCVLEHLKGLGNEKERCLMPADNEVANSQGCSLQAFYSSQEDDKCHWNREEKEGLDQLGFPNILNEHTQLKLIHLRWDSTILN